MLSDRDQILNLIERYCWAADHQQWDEWLDCFAEDGAFDVRGRRVSGREALRAFILEEVGESFTYVRHLVFNPSIELEGDSRARGRCYFEVRGTNIRGTDFEALGSYEDEMVKTTGGWKFRLRRARFDYFVRRGGALGEGGDPQPPG